MSKTFTKDELLILMTTVKIALLEIEWQRHKVCGEYTLNRLERFEEQDHKLTNLLDKIDKELKGGKK